MNSKIHVNIADEIKSRCNIVDVIGRVVSLKKSGSNYKGVCPFHNEKTPSFVVSEKKQIFTCFGCGASGDVIAFVEKYYNLDFKGAAEMLAKEYGINIEGSFSSNKDKAELYEINRLAARFFFKAMRQGANSGYTYMKNRGISEDILNKFGIGYADNNWTSLYDYMKSENIPDDKLLELGLISHSKGRYYDKFRDRVIFPIINTSGKVIGFGGRIISQGEPKYLNSQESNIFQKKNNLYGLNLTGNDVRNNDEIILVEGYMDVISLYQRGVRNVSASLGTALTENQVRLIKRYTKNVVLSYDSDAAGQNAALRGLDILYAEGCRSKVLKVTDGKDPDEFIKKNGKKAFEELLNKAMPYGDFKLNFARGNFDLSDSQQRLEYLRKALSMISLMKPIEADIYIKKLSEETGISEGAIRVEFSGNNRQEESFISHEKHFGREVTLPEEIPQVEQELLKLMLTDFRYAQLPEDIKDSVFTTVFSQTVYEIINELIPLGNNRINSQIEERLDEEFIEPFKKLCNKIIPQGRENDVFEDCINKIRKNILRQKEEKLIIQLSMADEDENHKQIIELTQQLIDIQKKLKE